MSLRERMAGKVQEPRPNGQECFDPTKLMKAFEYCEAKAKAVKAERKAYMDKQIENR
jgi:hypothetical protein